MDEKLSLIEEKYEKLAAQMNDPAIYGDIEKYTAAAKEQKEVHDSVRKMSEMNPVCKHEIWDKAGHNIPPLFADKFNELICSLI